MSNMSRLRLHWQAMQSLQCSLRLVSTNHALCSKRGHVCLTLLRSAAFWPPFVVYISIIIRSHSRTSQLSNPEFKSRQKACFFEACFFKACFFEMANKVEALSFLFNRFTSYIPIKFKNKMIVDINHPPLDLNLGLQHTKQMTFQCSISPNVFTNPWIWISGWMKVGFQGFLHQ